MAKQLSVIKLTGKIGDIVGMKNGFGTSATAFARKKAEVVSNPQSNTQMLQRIKMLPAVLVRRQLEEVIRRAWQGTKYGGQSMREFMKYAMKMPLSDVPQILKDSANPIPGPYMISKGSLQPVSMTLNGDDFKTNIPVTTEWENSSVAEFSQSLIDAGFAKEGDQFTLVLAKKNSSGFIVWSVISIFVEPQSSALLSDVIPERAGINILDGDFITIMDTAVGGDLVAAAVVISREGSTPLRSTATLTINRTMLSEYFGSTIKPEVLASYKTASSSRTSTDWPYDEGAETPVATEDGEYTLSGLTGAAAAKNGTKVKVKYIAGTEELYAVYAYTNEDSPLVGAQPFCVGTNGQPVSYTDSGDETGLSVSAVAAFAGLRQIAVS